MCDDRSKLQVNSNINGFFILVDTQSMNANANAKTPQRTTELMKPKTTP